MATRTKIDAEARYARSQKRVHEAATAYREAETEARRVNEKTARLKALRLAKGAADEAAKAAVPAKPTKAVKPAKPKAKDEKPKPRRAIGG